MELTFILNNKTGRNELYWVSAHGAGGSEGWLRKDFRQMKQAIRQRYGRSDYSTFDWSRWDYTGEGGKVLARHTCSMVYPGHAKLDWFRMDVYDYLHGQSPAPIPECMSDAGKSTAQPAPTRTAVSASLGLGMPVASTNPLQPSSLDLVLPAADPANDFLSVEVFEQRELRPRIPGV